MIRDLIIKNRSYRRFFQSDRISREQLTEWVELARFSASGRNAQSLRYILVTDEETGSQIFPLVSWAGFLKGWGGPAEGERPAAYIVMLHDSKISNNYYCDDGIAAQSIMLGAVEAGYGGCIMASVQRTKLREILSLEDRYEIIQVLALGRPAEKVVLEDIKDDDFKYWRDEEGVHHVPKRKLDELILY
ncbi:nitroreductase family protein [Sunxiuqinia sp. A32]|uniref:nitroreductase family protein n=1 Tax=Sunxiuqinia sp. A32 TaxID=3461496 RepID=UPI0040467BCC